MNNIITLPQRGRPEGELALSMHVTALALDNSEWDGPESGLLMDAYRANIRIACNADADPGSRTEAGKAAMLLAQLIEGDRAENQRHSRQVGHLRVLNGRLEIAGNGQEESAPKGA